MSRSVYTYTDLAKIRGSKNFNELIKYPHITVSTDLRKCLKGNLEYDKVQGIFADQANFCVSEFHNFAKPIDDNWISDQNKFNEVIILSEYLRTKIEKADNDPKQKKWLIGCMRNIDSILSSIILLEQAGVMPEDLVVGDDRNLVLFVDAWKYLVEKNPAIKTFRDNMAKLTNKHAWDLVFKEAFNIDSASSVDSIVFHGFYYITPHQERIMRLLEQSGFNLIFLIPYDERYPYVYEIWDDTYSFEKGFDPKDKWHIENNMDDDPYGEIFEGREAEIQNNLVLKEYASIMEFVDDVKHIKEKGYSLYSADFKSVNQVLKDYFPEQYGERKILSYPIGQFISTLNRMWDEDAETIAIDAENLIECFSSGWLSVDGHSAKQYMQDLMYVLPFFSGCHTIEDWEKRISLYKDIEDSAISTFDVDLDPDILVSRWQEAIGSPFKNFSMFSVDSEKIEIILKLIKQLLDMAKELFGKNDLVHIHHHIRTLDKILKKYELSQELYSEERDLVKDIFENLSKDNSFDTMVHPADIARALDLFICGRYEEGEIQTKKVGLVYPLYFVDAACIKNNSKVHICMSDVNSLPGGNKEYIWPLTGKKIKETYDITKNSLIQNIIQIMESSALCNRYFTYCALKNRNVTISWVSTMGDKMLAPSPYIKLLMQMTGVAIKPPFRNTITYKRVSETENSAGRTVEYDNEKAPFGMIKEARMDYALCPMKYVMGYVLEKHPTYQSEFHMNYALNAFISAIYDLMKDKGVSIDEAYKEVIGLFPNMRKVERRQIYDYISYDRKDDDIDYKHRTECGGRYYTDERLRIHYPNQDVREDTIACFGKLNTPDGRRGMNLYEATEIKDACTFCQHISYCRNAVYSVDQENYYD